MVRPGYPFRDRDPNRREDMAGNRRDDMAGNRRDEMAGNRRDDPVGNRRDEAGGRRDDQAGGRRDQPRPDRRPRPDTPAGGADLGSLAADIEALLRLISGSDVTELQIERGDLKVVIRRGPLSAPPAASTVQPLPLGGLHLGPGTLVAGDVRGGAPARRARAPAPRAARLHRSSCRSDAGRA